MCHTLCGLVRQGAKVYRCNFISKARAVPAVALTAPLTPFCPSTKRLWSFTQTARTTRLEFHHASNLDYPRFWNISFSASSVVPQLTS